MSEHQAQQGAEPEIVVEPDAAGQETNVEAPPSEESTPASDPVAELRESWGKNWRDVTAAGDEKLRKELDRFTSYETWVKSAQEARKALSGRAPLPKADAAPEAIAEFFTKTAKGTILEAPETPEGYAALKPKLPEGVEALPEDVAPIVDAVRAKAAAEKWPTRMTQTAVDFVAELLIEDEKAAEAEAKRSADKAKAALSGIWPGEVERNLQVANASLRHWANEAGVDPGEFVALRLRDGTPITNHPLWAQLWATVGRAQMEDLRFSMTSDTERASSVEQLEREKQGIMKLMNGNALERRRYDAPETQARLTEINTTLSRLKPKAR